jgi:hypothetical protein
MQSLLNLERDMFRKSLDLDDFVKDSQRIVQDYRCPLCLGIYLNPVVDQCGHVFCKNCIIKYMETESKCPFSQWNLDQNLLNKIVLVNDILEKQFVLCKNRIYYCNWVGKLIDLENHQGEECSRQVLKCPHDRCPDSIFREDLKCHKNSCEYRIIPCQDCDILISFIDIILHQEVCTRYKLPCPQSCGSLVERKDVELHKEQSCFNTIIDCPYKDIGCPTRITKKELENYLTANTNRHNIMLMTSIQGFMFEINKKFHALNSDTSNKEEIKKLEEKVILAISHIDHTNFNENDNNIDNTVKKSLKTGSPIKNKIRTQEASPSSSISSQIDKQLGRKRHRKNDDSPLNINKASSNENQTVSAKDINLVIKEKEENCNSNSSQNSNSPLNTISSVKISADKKKENISYFDVKNLVKGINIINNNVFSSTNIKAEHRYVFTNFVINSEKEFEWKMGFNLTSSWAAVGVCIKEVVVENKFKFVTSNNTFYNGTFTISTNGYQWNCNTASEFNTHINNFSPIKKGDYVIFKYLCETKELTYKFSNKLCGKFTNVTPLRGGSLVPCIVLLNPGDEISFEPLI